MMIGYDAGTGSETGREFYHADYLGSIIATSEGDAGAGNAIQDTYTYSAYGETGQEGPTGNPFRYTGRRLDAETGLYYYRARYYAPAWGRFLQTDPVGYGDGMNMYAYVGNDPVNNTDPSGLEGCENFNTYRSSSGYCLDGPSGSSGGDEGTEEPGVQLGNYGTDTHEETVLDELSLDPMNGQAESAPEVVELLVPGGLFAGGLRNLGKRSIKDLSAKLGYNVAKTFAKGQFRTYTLQSDVVLYRFATATGEKLGSFLTTRRTVASLGSSGEAVKALNLGVANNAANILQQVLLPRGSQVLVGRVAGGAPNATQVFVPDPSVLALIKEIAFP